MQHDLCGCWPCRSVLAFSLFRNLSIYYLRSFFCLFVLNYYSVRCFALADNCVTNEPEIGIDLLFRYLGNLLGIVLKLTLAKNLKEWG